MIITIFGENTRPKGEEPVLMIALAFSLSKHFKVKCGFS